MGRFYKTAVPEFVENYMYQPPWELAKQAMAVNEQGIQDSLNAANLLKNVDINYIPEAGQKAIVDRIQKKYTEAADNISKNIQLGLSQSPESWKKFSPEISNLGSTLQKDIKSGEIATITQSYNNHNKWLEDNKDIKEKDPLLYQAAYNTFMTRWMKNPNRSDVWQGEDLPDFDIHSKDIMDGLKEFEADIQTKVANGYITDIKFLSKDRIIQAYMGRVMSDPKAQAYLHKAIQYGVPGFVDENGKPNPFYKFVDTKTGQEASPGKVAFDKSVWDNMTPAQRSKAGLINFNYKEVVNSAHPWMKAFEAYGEQREFSQTKVSADATYNSARERANALRIANMRISAEFALKKMDIDAKKTAAKEKAQQDNAKNIINLEAIIEAYGANSKEGKLAAAKLKKEKTIAQGFIVPYYQNIDFESGQKAINAAKGNNPTAEDIVNSKLAKELNKKGYSNFIQKYGKNLSKDDIKFINYVKDKLDGSNTTFSSTLFRNDNIKNIVMKYLKKKGYKEDYLTKDRTDITKPFKTLLSASPLTAPLGAALSMLPIEKTLPQKNAAIVNKYMKLLNNLTNETQSVYKELRQSPTEITVLPVTEKGKKYLRAEITEMPEQFVVTPLDIKEKDKSKHFSVLDILNSGGEVTGITPDSKLNQGVIIKDNQGRRYVVNNNNSINDARSRNAKIFNNSEIYTRQEDYDIFNLVGKKDIGSLATGVISLLTSDRNDNLMLHDPHKKDRFNKPAAFAETGIPTGNVDAVKVRFYPDLGIYEVHSYIDKNGEVTNAPQAILDRIVKAPGEEEDAFTIRAMGEIQGSLAKMIEHSN